MSDFNADDIARIATRLLNQTPGGAPEIGHSDFSGQIPHNSIPASVSEAYSGASPYTSSANRSQSYLPNGYQSHSHGGDFYQPKSTSGQFNDPSFPGQTDFSSQECLLKNAFRSAAGKIQQQSFQQQSSNSYSKPVPSGFQENSESYGQLKRFVKQVRGVDVKPEDVGVNTHHFAPGQFSNLNRAYTPRPLDVNAIRKDFPVLQQEVHGYPLAWFDNAATTQKPQHVIDAISRFYQEDNSNIHRGAHTLAARATDAYESARQKVQRFLKASRPEEIIFVRGTSEGINLIAHTYGKKYLQPGDEIILSTLEHHANIVPWQMIARENQLQLRIVPVNDRGEILLEEYKRLLGPRTKFVALTQASNSLGTILPVQEMTALAKRHGARVLIDGAQSVSHMSVDVRQLGCDFFVFSGHKIFGPTGIGAVYAREDVQELMPPWQGGGNMIKNVTFEETTYSDPPAKFEAGTPNIADAVGLGAALDYVNQFGVDNIGHYEHELLSYATEKLSRIKHLRILGTAQKKVSVISFVLKNHSPIEVGKYLDQYGIAVRAGHHCSQPSLRRFGQEATVRPSFSFYNTFEEIDRLASALVDLT